MQRTFFFFLMLPPLRGGSFPGPSKSLYYQLLHTVYGRNYNISFSWRFMQIILILHASSHHRLSISQSLAISISNHRLFHLHHRCFHLFIICFPSPLTYLTDHTGRHFSRNRWDPASDKLMGSPASGF